ncbi:flagellar hook-basal body complex protein FliE [Calidifontibacillus oryziterrae]|uniref:flagellar hook-basal body complex protein FliE n=1 Tax=Calidifontibacillus oryziterrae TaxID=1191699 RepID=UPI00031D2E6A|nr:flagellar hook-basal body complex protein FliE [Calidifontibacillus oryziterrae]
MERISPFNMNQPIRPYEINNTQKATAADAHKRFSEALSNAINDLNKSQIQSDTTTEKFITGQISDIHEVMIAAQKASVTRQAAIEVRNKVIDAYKEIMRMQV